MFHMSAQPEESGALTWDRCWDHLNLGWTGALDVASLVSPVKPVSVPVQIEGEDAVVRGEQMDFGGAFTSKLQHVDAAGGSVNEPWICGTKRSCTFL